MWFARGWGIFLLVYPQTPTNLHISSGANPIKYISSYKTKIAMLKNIIFNVGKRFCHMCQLATMLDTPDLFWRTEAAMSTVCIWNLDQLNLVRWFGLRLKPIFSNDPSSIHPKNDALFQNDPIKIILLHLPSLSLNIWYKNLVIFYGMSSIGLTPVVCYKCISEQKFIFSLTHTLTSPCRRRRLSLAKSCVDNKSVEWLGSNAFKNIFSLWLPDSL